LLDNPKLQKNYSYDEFNNCTGYIRTEGQEKEFSVERARSRQTIRNLSTENAADTIVYNSGIGGRHRESETKHDESKNLSPRVKWSNDFVGSR